MNTNKKYAMPHIRVQNKSSIDLFFELVSLNDRKKFFQDFDKNIEITSPNFFVKDLNINISNDIKQFSKKDFDEKELEKLELYRKNEKEPSRTLIQYDDSEHKFKPKSKFDSEKILKEVIKSSLLSIIKE